MKSVIKNANIVLPDCSGYEKTDVLIENGIISAIGSNLTADKVVDARGKYLLPGFIDIHNHGALGMYFGSEDADYIKMLMFFAKNGVTTVIPTTGTNTVDVIVNQIKNIVSFKEKGVNKGARIGGIHLEGPFISNEKKGAMAGQSPDCTVENFNRFIKAGKGEIKIMTIAPERENAIDVIKAGVKCGVCMSLGHTMATYDEAMAAINAGANHATHTFNAMRSYNHREPGVLGAVLTAPSVDCEVICDMVHLNPITIEIIRRTKGLDKMILISDAVPITGLPNGEYVVYDGQVRIVKDGVSVTKTGTIAGSCFTMGDSTKKLVNNGYSIADIAKIGALNPARAVGLENKLGTIEKGKYADMLICDENMNIEQVILRGESLL